MSSKAAAARAERVPAEPAVERVRATKPGFYNDYPVAVGQVFTLRKPGDFSARWMERVDPSTPDDFAKLPKRQAAPAVLEGRHFHKTHNPDAVIAPAKPKAAPAAPAVDDDSVI
jgi:hypothetical protein